MVDVKQLERDNDVIGLFRSDHPLTLKQAADACLSSDETIRLECVKTAATNNALGVMFERRWILDKTRVLEWIERVVDVSARLTAESRLKKYASRPQPQQPRAKALERTTR
jgi:hypothetical protein